MKRTLPTQYDKQRPALPWALGIAAWECRTFLKRQQRHQETSEQPQFSDSGAAVSEAEKRLLVEAAMHAMGTLSDADQDADLDVLGDGAGRGGRDFPQAQRARDHSTS